MSILSIVIRELLHRKLNALLSLFAVAAASGAIIVCFGLLHLFDFRTERIIAEKQAQAASQNAALEDEYRKITLKMGFNILILPDSQNLADLYANDFAGKTMPAWYADTLAHSKIVTIQHLLPVLQQKIKWPEAKRTILLVGTKGEIPLAFGGSKKAMSDVVPRGSIIMGFELATSLNLKKGGTLKLLGRDFKILGTYSERGNKDDITAWINLQEAQELLRMPGLINGIMALECACAMATPDMVRKEISAILPHTKVVEFSSQALTRAEARRKASDFAQASLAAEKQNRERLRSEKDLFFSIFLLVLTIASAVWIGLLAYSNVRERRTEIGIFRSLGYRSCEILSLFMIRALLLGAIGGLAGLAGGVGFLQIKLIQSNEAIAVLSTIAPLLLFGVFAGTLIMSAAASWLPTLMAVNQDPAVVLRQE